MQALLATLTLIGLVWMLQGGQQFGPPADTARTPWSNLADLKRWKGNGNFAIDWSTVSDRKLP